MSKENYLTSDFDWPEEGMRKALELMCSQSREKYIIVDVGAHQGETADIARRAVVDGSVEYIAIEANPDTYALLEKRIAAYQEDGLNARSIHAAAGPNNGSVCFSSTKASAVAGVLAPVDGLSARVPGGDHEVLATNEVSMVAIDSLFGAGDRVGLLKVDAEGFDLEVLKGALNLLQSQRVDVVLSEVFFVAYRQGQAYFWDIAGYLASLGYMFVNVFDARNTSQGRLYTGNGVWVSPQLGAALSYL